MRLATFNLESFGTDKADDPALDARLAVLRPQIERLDADILCLQEINAQKIPGGGGRRPIALDRLLADLPVELYHRAWSGDLSPAPDIHTLAILSRYPIRDARLLRHDLIAPPLWQRSTADPPDEVPVPIEWDRPILTAEIDMPGGKPLHVFNVHLRAPLAAPIPGGKEAATVWKRCDAWAEGYAIAAMKRIGQAAELRRAIDALFDADPETRLAAVGDFNADAFESALRIAIAESDDTGNGALANRTLVPVERMLAADRRHTVLHLGRPLMLDHVLVSRSLLAHLDRVEVHNETLLDEAIAPLRANGPTASYHAPLMAIFRD
ncbi:MAG: endonuclease [Hyphomicrobiales bacterium]|nr:MAG: endonuclease [Hyphomicrobiales bacterium]